MRQVQSRGVLLDCEHTVWFKPIYAPSPGEIVWCAKCATYSTVPKHDHERGTYYPDGDWFCYAKGRVKSRGVCNACGHEFVAPFNQLRTHMEKHNRTGCEHVLGIQVTQLPPNSPPPF